MEKILLVSANFIKNVTNIDDNMPGKLIEPAIYEAQNEGLRTVLGDCLVDRLEELVDNGDIDREGYEMHRKLLTKCQYYLTYTVMTNICMLTTVKVSPAGLEQVSDEHMEPLDMDDSFRLQSFYQKKADYLCHQLQNYVLNNKTAYPELKECDCRRMKVNLFSSATTGLWLGGVRNPKRYNSYRRK